MNKSMPAPEGAQPRHFKDLGIRKIVWSADHVGYHYGDHDTELPTYPLELFDMFTGVLDRLYGLVNLLGPAALASFGPITEALLRDVEVQIKEAEAIINREIGTIHCIVVDHGVGELRFGQVIDATFEDSRKEDQDG